ncbi:uncharacterized protein UTRI_06208_B [Ustilago trichophora]|uniref:Uncharacterized protein n=1 Tax=Ustilago trichophora TaxID=86804 RepID=A0A5C3EGW5_9BASI|nr:uncharacterized protein UTRI_06208_B [Ustilago trichophora]
MASPVSYGSKAGQSSRTHPSSPTISVGGDPGRIRDTIDSEAGHAFQSQPMLQEPDALILNSQWILDEMVRQRQASGFAIGPIQIHSVPIHLAPHLETPALSLLQQPDTKLAQYTIMHHPTSASTTANPWRTHILMTPAPVNSEWFRWMDIPYTPQTLAQQPLLFYEYYTRANSRIEYVKLVGVGIVDHHENAWGFLQRWWRSAGVKSFEEIRGLAHAGHLIPRT